jgi:hypothetical protein
MTAGGQTAVVRAPTATFFSDESLAGRPVWASPLRVHTAVAALQPAGGVGGGDQCQRLPVASEAAADGVVNSAAEVQSHRSAV